MAAQSAPTVASELEAEGTRDPEWAIHRMKCLLDVGAKMIRAESEGITENVKSWRSHVNARFVIAIGLDHLMFEVADLRSLTSTTTDLLQTSLSITVRSFNSNAYDRESGGRRVPWDES